MYYETVTFLSNNQLRNTPALCVSKRNITSYHHYIYFVQNAPIVRCLCNFQLSTPNRHIPVVRFFGFAKCQPEFQLIGNAPTYSDAIQTTTCLT